MAAVEGARPCLRVRRKGAAAPPPLPAFVGAAAVTRISPSGAWMGECLCVTVSFLRLMSYSSGMWDVVRLSECGG